MEAFDMIVAVLYTLFQLMCRHGEHKILVEDIEPLSDASLKRDKMILLNRYMVERGVWKTQWLSILILLFLGGVVGMKTVMVVGLFWVAFDWVSVYRCSIKILVNPQYAPQLMMEIMRKVIKQ
jgi:hypothetical protein